MLYLKLEDFSVFNSVFLGTTVNPSLRFQFDGDEMTIM